ncbi:unnamed protein product [Brassica rapa]|uniref:Potassium transporter n=1 Tax=Brassica campestris TaxID=3711 RepID=A0A8D9GNJ9_BRACM|nr:unnamed protein product [Brassica rapa]
MSERVEASVAEGENTIKERHIGAMWELEQKLDQSMDEEANKLKNMYRENSFSMWMLLRLSFQSLGIVYGDLGTSPLYVFYNTFPDGIDDTEDVIGALSLIIYSLLLIPLIKYVFIVCKANDNGQGGTLAIYSLLCRHAKVILIPNQQRRDGWISLGGILLSITGTEALYADIAYFPLLAIQLAFTFFVFPCLLLSYCGQAAYLVNNKDHYDDAFYASIPRNVYWPMFVVATGAAIVGSQAAISGTYSIIKQAVSHGCFPRVKIVHTSKKFVGQIYCPDINWMLMLGCIAVTASFKNQSQIGNAYGKMYGDSDEMKGLGTAVVLVMLVTTLLMVLTMLLVWRCHWILVLIFAFLSLVVELSYFSAVLLKVNQGGWVPLIIAAISLLVMSVWQYATVKKYEFEMHSKVSMSWILGLGPSLGLVRVPGVGLVYTELASGVPHIFSHFITNLPAIHSVVVFVCVKYLPVYTVPEEERFLVKRIGPKKFRMFRCVARYGYKDLHRKDDDFENKLLTNLSSFIRIETMMEPALTSSTYSSAFSVNYTQESRDELLRNNSNHNNSNMDMFSSMVDYTVSTLDTIVPADSPRNATSLSQNNTVEEEEEEEEEDELEFLKTCKESGVVHIMGNTVVKARNGSWLPKKIAIDYVYAFLDKICRENSVILHVPHETLLNVGQVFYI